MFVRTGAITNGSLKIFGGKISFPQNWHHARTVTLRLWRNGKLLKKALAKLRKRAWEHTEESTGIPPPKTRVFGTKKTQLSELHKFDLLLVALLTIQISASRTEQATAYYSCSIYLWSMLVSQLCFKALLILFLMLYCL